MLLHMQGDKTPDVSVTTYAERVKAEALRREKEETLRLIAKKKAEEAERKAALENEAPTKAQGILPPPPTAAAAPAPAASAPAGTGKRRNRWDMPAPAEGAAAPAAEAK